MRAPDESRNLRSLGYLTVGLGLSFAVATCTRWSAEDSSGGAVFEAKAAGGAGAGATGTRSDEDGTTPADGGQGGRASEVDETAGAVGHEAAGANAVGEVAPDEGGHLPYAAPEPGPEALPARTWKLSHAEYARSAALLLGKEVDVSGLEPELDNGVYPGMSASGLVRVPLARSYYELAKSLTDALGDDELAALVPGGELASTSKSNFIAGAVARAFRRPPTDDELTSYAAIFDLGASEGDLGLGFRSVLRALLTAPYFLYRTEIGDDASADEFSLTDDEIASLLSYRLLGGPPPEALMAAASRGELGNPDGLADAVAALSATPEASATLASFASAWLEVSRFRVDASGDAPPFPEKDPAGYPGFEDVRAEMLAETTTFLADHAGPDVTLRALLTTPVPAAKGALGAFYRSDPSGADGGARTGVLGLGTLLSLGASVSASSPTQRGLFLRQRLLCQDLQPPNVAPPALPAAAASDEPTTTRARYEQHAANPKCAGCHTLLDSVGFALESFDAAGRFRSNENGIAVDTSAELWNTDVDGRYADHAELAAALAESEWVRECVATQAFRSYFGELEAGRGIPPIQAARKALGDGAFGDLVRALFGTPSTYRRRRP